MLLKSLLVSGQHLPTRSSVAFPVIHLAMRSAVDPLSLLAKGAFCTALPFFPCDFYEVVPFFSLIYWFCREDFLTFSRLQLVCWVLYTIWRHLQRGWFFFTIYIHVDFEWQNWVRVYNRYNSYVCFIVTCSFERLKSLRLLPKGDKYVISQNVLSQLAVL